MVSFRPVVALALLVSGDLQIGMLMGERFQVYWRCGVAKLAEAETLAR
jgi:mannose/fructose/N-acetylgalactosamine-specific phosphotransferase system component IIC